MVVKPEKWQGRIKKGLGHLANKKKESEDVIGRWPEFVVEQANVFSDELPRRASLWNIC